MAAGISNGQRDWYLHGGGPCPAAARGLRIDVVDSKGEVHLNMANPNWSHPALSSWRPAAGESLPANFHDLLQADKPSATVDIADYDVAPKSFTLPLTGPYSELARTLVAAYQQASSGKGKERHAVDGVAFQDQPMTTINRQLGSIDGFIYQAHKKSLEAKRLPNGRAQAELLGAINYLAGAAIALDSWAAKPAAPSATL